MSLDEIALIGGGAAIGVAAGSLAVYFNSRKRSNKKPNEAIETEQESSLSSVDSSAPTALDAVAQNPLPESSATEEKLSRSAVSRTIPKAILDKSKRELRTLLLEKELVSAALTRLYEAEAAKEITREERELLAQKYREELKTLDEKILKIDAFIEVGDLETLRDQLIRLVNQKMDSIDRRIDHTRKVAEPLIAQMLGNQGILAAERPREEKTLQKPRVPDLSDLILPEKVREEQPQLATASSPELESSSPPMVEANVATTTNDSASLDAARLRRKALSSTGRESKDSQAEQLQRELLEALDRLEKLDVES